MASNTSRSTDLVLQSSTRPAQLLARGESTHVTARAGEHYGVQATSGDRAVRLEDDVLAIRRGDDLALRYGDGTEVVLDRFFVECVRAQCSVELSAGEAAPHWINGDKAAGATNGSGEALLYAHGDEGTIGTLMKAEGFVASGSTGIGELAGMTLAQGQATYLPAGHGEGAADAGPGTPAMIGLGALALGGLALAAGGGGGSSGVSDGSGGSSNAPSGGDKPGGSLDGGNSTPTTIEGTVVAGPVIAGHGLEVQVYSAAGQLLESGPVQDDGSYSVEIDGSYRGPVLVRIRDTTQGADYRDEASNTDRDLGIDLRAFSVVADEPVVHVNVNLLTELAVRSLGLDGGNDGGSTVSLGGHDAVAIIAANHGVAQAFGLGGDLVGGAAPVPVITAAGAPAAAANDYGRILAALSGAEDNGDTNGVLAMLQAGYDHNALSPAAIAAVITGAAAAAVAGTPALGLVSSVATLLNAGTGGNGGNGSLRVDPIAGDNIITKHEAEEGLVVSGHGTPGSTVTVTWGDQSLQADVNADGVWSVDLAGLELPADGASTLQIAQGDQVLVRAVFLATTPPAAGDAISGFMGSDEVQHDIGDYVGNTSESKPAFLIGTGLSGTPALYINGDWVEATYDPVKGTLTPVEPLGEGEKTFTWTLSDALGNESAPSEGRTLNVDLTAPLAPDAPVGYVDNAGPIKSEVSTAASTDDVRPVLLTGALDVEPGAIVRLYVNGDLVDAEYDPVHGTLTLANDLPAGVNAITMRVVDAVGNVSEPSPAMSLTVITTAPATPAAATSYVDNSDPSNTEPRTDSKTTDATPGLYVGVNLAGAPSLYVGDVKVNATYDAATGTLTPDHALTRGVNALSFTLTNAHGESARSEPFLVDIGDAPQPPEGIINYIDDVEGLTSTLMAPSHQTLTNDSRPEFLAGPGESHDPILLVDNVAVRAIYDSAKGTLTPVDALTEGSHAIGYQTVNDYGVSPPSTTSFDIQIDVTAPEAGEQIFYRAEPSSSHPGQENQIGLSSSSPDTKPVFVLGLTSSLASGETPILYIDGVRVEAVQGEVQISGEDGRNTIDKVSMTPTSELQPGPHSVSWSVMDDAGNISQPSTASAFTVSLGAPAIFDDVPFYTGQLTDYGWGVLTNDNLPSIKVGAGLAGVFRLYDGETEILSSYDPVSGMLTPQAALADGSHALHYSVGVGGEALVSSAMNLTVDTVAPAYAAYASLATPISSYYGSGGLSSSPTTESTQPTFIVPASPDWDFMDGSWPSLIVDGVVVPISGYGLGGNDFQLSLSNAVDRNYQLGVGPHEIAWGLMDQAGNISESSPTFSLEVVAPASGNSMAPQMMSLPTSDAIDLAALTGSVDVAGSGSPTMPMLVSGLDAALSQQAWQAVIQSLEQNNGGA